MIDPPEAALAELALSPSLGTPAARAAAVRMTIDTLGCLVAGREEPGVPILRDLAREAGGAGQATVLCHGGRLPVAEAAFINSVMAHALDLDDVHLPGILHIMCVVLPAALAVGEHRGCSGADLLDAVIAGVEVAGRIARCHRPRVAHDHFLPTSICGVFGAAVACSRILGHDRPTMQAAMGIAYAHAGGNRQALYEGALTKRLQPAIAARAGVWSALAADRGFTGAIRPLTGKGGLYRSFAMAAPPDHAELMAERPYREIERLSVKTIPTCGAHHPAIAAALALAAEERVDPAQIERVELYLFDKPGCSPVERPFVLTEHPQTEAQFAAPYAVALALVHGDVSLERFRDRSIREDGRTLGLVSKVRFVHRTTHAKRMGIPSDAGGPYLGYPQVVTVVHRDGRVREKAACAWDVLNPAAVDERALHAKLADCVAFGGMPAERAGMILEAVSGLARQASVGRLVGSCVP